jgi:glutamine amidotransferase
MGWNNLNFRAPSHPLFEGLPAGAHAYFVHSYGFSAADPADILADVDYGGPTTAAVGRGNLAGTQFHPEKSQAVGLKLITNFLKWRP